MVSRSGSEKHPSIANGRRHPGDAGKRATHGPKRGPTSVGVVIIRQNRNRLGCRLKPVRREHQLLSLATRIGSTVCGYGVVQQCRVPGRRPLEGKNHTPEDGLGGTVGLGLT